MDKRRLFLAFVLMMIVAVAPSIIWPTKPTARRPDGRTAGDTSAVQVRERDTSSVAAVRPSGRPTGRPTVATSDTGRTVWVTSPLYRLGFSTRGGRLVSAELLQYQSFAPGDSAKPVQLVPPGDAFLRHRLVLASGDTVSLDDWSFQPSPDAPGIVVYAEQGAKPLRFDAESRGSHVTLEYAFVPDQYRFDVHGAITGLGSSGAVLLIDLADGLRSAEKDSLDDYRHYAIVTKASKTERTDFSGIKPGQRALFNGPFEWVGVKSKYFFTAALALEEGQPTFAGAVAVGGERTGRAASRADVMITMPVPPSGTFRYQVYAGPLENRHLAPLGHGLDDANPYGGIFRPIIQPVSVFVVNILLWMHERLHLAYGWVLILFGIVIRILLWPLNQKAMESGIRMQAVAPLLKETQDKYKDDPARLQREMMRIYKEYKVNPLGGCLPMLLPWPVLLALFFVFANTIVFRGVPFLWLPDLSRPDPYKIIPILLGLSMFGLSKVGQIGVPPNPQTKMMVYFMPIFMTVLFLNFASGLNLYYAAQNIFSIPQQYLIAKKRLREAPVPRAAPAAPAAPAPTPAPRR
ncbi:MAG TPA: membrane protein insertase YidC [Gemmatimonadales bacterium]|jgi:YidC/Oxa1 family membrane protein insertase|nr:membrane protein insertase YidC [Gemmatimonadales bacterium]